MRKAVLVLLLALLAALNLSATDKTVKAGGGGDYTTITACKNAMANGDRCIVYAGNYISEGVITISAGASALSPKTLTVNGTDLVYVQNFTINSYDYIDGFHLQNPSSPTAQNCININANAVGWRITNNDFYACGKGSDNGAIRFSTTVPSNISNGYIGHNTFSYTCSTSASPNICSGMYVSGDYTLIENNDFSHMADMVTLFGSHNVFRNNLIHDVHTNECGSNSSNCHIDVIQSEPSGGVKASYNLYENNTVVSMLVDGCPAPINSGCSTHVFLTQAEACSGQCTNVIIRFNTSAHVGTYGLINDNSGHPEISPGFVAVKSYNNTWVDFNHNNYDNVNGWANNSTNGAEINDIFYWPISNLSTNAYSRDTSSATGWVDSNNLAYCISSCTFYGNVYQTGTFTSRPGNKVTDPKFTNYAGGDYSLQSSSPARGAGTYLTTANGSGSNSTSLTVVDASFFFDGASGMVQADWIRIGASTTVQICGINYGTNVITLCSAVSWNSGDGIYLYKLSDGTQVLFGANPDMGAEQYQSPTGSAIGVTGSVVGHAVNLSWSVVTAAQSYNVYRSLTSGSGYSLLINIPAQLNYWTDTTVQAGTTYYYKGTYNDSGGEHTMFTDQQYVIPSP